MISSNIMQRKSAEHIIQMANRFDKPVIIGGPLTSTLPHVFNGENTTKVIGEIESIEVSHRESGETVAEVLSHDMRHGTLRPLYQAAGHPDITKNRIPRYDLINPRHYFNLSLQTSRGCHHCCDFCQEVPLYGKHQRKKTRQVIDELDAVLLLGERKSIYIIDDNFMGNIDNPGIKMKLIDLLCAIEEWQKENDYPFDFFCQCSLEVADHNDIVELMVRIGLNMLFIGIESVDQTSLASVHKQQNLSTDMAAKIGKLQQAGMGIFAGMIIGFDNDSTITIQKQIEFVRQSKIPLVGASLLLAFPGTRLHKKLLAENRISPDRDALTKSFRSNVIFRQPPSELYGYYVNFTKAIYGPEEYFNRCLAWAAGWNDAFVLPGKKGSLQVNLLFSRILKSFITQGIAASYCLNYWNYMLRSFLAFRHNRNKLALAFYLGYYYRVVDNIVKRLESFSRKLPAELNCEWERRFGTKS
ncbi:MAG: DUF4070 domain-containing protein [Chitinispirillaceae bacterium]|nr:DUF4070 domain-containing protein [Chitinispirillaceae bacterium]